MAVPIEEHAHVRIPMSDGCHLSARIWRPIHGEPVPAILEYIPYRHRDFTALRDAQIHPFFAEHGYASVRVDLRGSGNSEGVLRDEYLPQELDDGIEVLRWIASQPWCDGQVGMFGLSWGGFNGLMLAARQPPELKCVVSVCSSDDRFADDVHYMGGAMLTDNLSWASNMFAYNSCPPDPMLVGDGWRDQWLERLQGSGLWIHTWLQHQRRDEYWKHASICEDYEKVRVPVYAVSGWADGYSNTVFRLVRNLPGPVKGLIGAWGHKYPHMTDVGEPIGFLEECVRWWDRWLKGLDTGIDREPALRVWMQDSTSPLTPSRPGRWVAESSWPSPRVTEHAFPLSVRGIEMGQGTACDEEEVWVQSPLSVGLFAGKWYSYAGDTDLPFDQREEDGGALVFDGPVLEEPLEVLGMPVAELELTVDKPVAMVAVRLSDIAPGGSVSRVTYGVLNLTHRESREFPRPFEPGRWERVRVPLNHIAQRFPAGNRVRVAISTSYWPLIWPSPEPVTIRVRTGKSTIVLPVRTSAPGDEALRPFPSPNGRPNSLRWTLLEPAHREWTVQHNLATNESVLQVINDDMRFRLDHIDWEVCRKVTERYSYRNYRYDTVRGEVSASRHFRRGEWRTQTSTRTVLTSTRTHFRLSATLDAYEGDSRIFSKSWNEVVPRDLI